MVKKIPLYKLAVLGDGGVGKTAIVVQFVLNHFIETYDPTIEESYRKLIQIDHQPCMLDILDSAGQEEYTALRDQWIRASEGVILVYSISSRTSFRALERFHAQINGIKQDDRFPILLVGNKSDRITEREVSSQEGMLKARMLGCKFTELSAKNTNNIEEPFSDIVRQIQKRNTDILSQSLEIGLVAQERSDGVKYMEVESVKYRAFKSIFRKFRRSDIYIPTEESNSEEGRIGLTARLIEAARANKEKEVYAYLAAGAYVDGQPGVDGAAIHASSAAGHVNIVNLLLRKNAGVNAISKGPSGLSPLQIAAAEGHSSIVRLLLHKGAQIEQSSSLHGTALCIAVARARVAIVQILLAKGAKVNTPGGPYGNALQAAAWVGNVAIIEALHRNGAEVNARGEGDCTALQVASYAGNEGAVRALLVRGALVDLPGGKYGRAFEAANARNHYGVIKLLLQYGASFDTLQLNINSAPSPLNNGSADQADWPLNSAMFVNPSFIPVPDPNNGPEVHSTPTEIKCIDSRPVINLSGFSTIFDPSDASIDVVFIHGLQGHPEKTWTSANHTLRKRSFRKSSTDLSAVSSDKAIFWPYDFLSKEDSLAHARILTWGYDTHVVTDVFGAADEQNISQHGNNLMVALQQERKRDPSRPMVFVAHSLGGILIKVALDKSKRSQYQPQYLQIYESTKGIVFIGTPHRGSTTASWGLLASNLAKLALQGPNEKILKNMKPNNEFLENIHMSFLQTLEDNKFKIHSFYETRSMVGLYGLRGRVVPPDSAQVGHARHEVIRHIDGNHSEICKFSTKTDGYKAVFGAIEDYVLAATNKIRI